MSYALLVRPDQVFLQVVVETTDRWVTRRAGTGKIRPLLVRGPPLVTT